MSNTLTPIQTEALFTQRPFLDLTQFALGVRSWSDHRGILAGSELLELERRVGHFAVCLHDHGQNRDTVARFVTSGFPQDHHDDAAAARVALMIAASFGVPVDPDWTDVGLPPRTNSCRRPLSAMEVAAYRTAVECASDKSRALWGTIVAFSEAGAGSTERGNVRVTDVNVLTRHLHLRGNKQRTTPRANKLTRWGAGHVADLLSSLPTNVTSNPFASITYRGSGNAAQATGNILNKVLKAAGLSAEDVDPESIRNSVGREHYQRQNPIDVQDFLGCASLDQALREIGILPHPPVRKRGRRAA